MNSRSFRHTLLTNWTLARYVRLAFAIIIGIEAARSLDLIPCLVTAFFLWQVIFNIGSESYAAPEPVPAGTVDGDRNQGVC